MATATATRPIKRTNPEVETSASDQVIISTKLKNLVQAWREKDNLSTFTWMKLADYVVHDENVTNKILTSALIEYRGMKETSAKVAASHMLGIRKSEAAQELLQRGLAGDKSVTILDLRSARSREAGGGELNEGEKLESKLRSAARYAIENGLVDDQNEFASAAGNAFAVIESKLAKKEAQEATGEEQEDESEGDE